ncbi:dipeptidase PepE [Flavicella sediminum]|uniref:dipeptidase PepE n=1 Tax=Flavicella sediminum TaxID=2585141 RepID=UPI00111DF4C4|nr:dipeptidase PepE [Flavicella sediminum]
MRNMIIASTSTLYNSSYLAYLQTELTKLLKNVKEVLFIPYARPSGLSYDEYTAIAQEGLLFCDVKVKGIHEFSNAKEAINKAQAIFVGGGNTFVLVKELYEQAILELLKAKIEQGTPYLGTSAGSNICGPTMQTTNDMPIVKPPSFETLGCLPFNINAHFLVADKNSTHKGETRETRIKEFHVYNNTAVLGLQEGSWLDVKEAIVLKGNLDAYWFQKNKPVKICTPNTVFDEVASE